MVVNAAGHLVALVVVLLLLLELCEHFFEVDRVADFAFGFHDANRLVGRC